jgi:hypothetical protein
MAIGAPSERNESANDWVIRDVRTDPKQKTVSMRGLNTEIEHEVG